MARVMIVDDADFVVQMYKDVLQTKGHEVVGRAKNGTEALEQYGQLRPDLVIMDVLMPEMDGLMALKKLLEVDPGASVLVVSGLEKPGLSQECLSAGARGFLVKPFEIADLFSKLAEILGSAE
jgi:two-component system chemotaxis response regulator CheY